MIRQQPRFTSKEWTYSNIVKGKNAEHQSKNAELLVGEAKRLAHEIDAATKRSQAEVDKRLDQKIEQLRYWILELETSTAKVKTNIFSMDQLCSRLESALKYIQEPLNCARQCIKMREARQGIEKVHDSAEKELLKEVEVIDGVAQILAEALEEAIEQHRKLKKIKYLLECDLKKKRSAYEIDTQMRELTLESPDLELNAPGHSGLGAGSLAVEVWETSGETIVRKAHIQVSASRELEARIARTLRDCECDIKCQMESTNKAIETRISEVRTAKAKLEDKLSMIREHIASVEQTISSLKHSIDRLTRPLAKAETRLRCRDTRPVTEMTNDAAQRQLLTERREIKQSEKRLATELHNAEIQLRNLDRERLVLEEDISVKSVTLEICEGQCQVHRKATVLPQL